MDVFCTVGRIDEVPPGRLKVFHVGERRVAVGNAAGTFYAVEDVCTHDGGPLGAGVLRGDEVECPRHGARFNVKSGAAVVLPAVAPVRTFAVRVVGGEIQVAMPE